MPANRLRLERFDPEGAADSLKNRPLGHPRRLSVEPVPDNLVAACLAVVHDYREATHLKERT
jgi:hypothetical protein